MGEFLTASESVLDVPCCEESALLRLPDLSTPTCGIRGKNLTAVGISMFSWSTLNIMLHFNFNLEFGSFNSSIALF